MRQYIQGGKKKPIYRLQAASLSHTYACFMCIYFSDRQTLYYAIDP